MLGRNKEWPLFSAAANVHMFRLARLVVAGPESFSCAQCGGRINSADRGYQSRVYIRAFGLLS